MSAVRATVVTSPIKSDNFAKLPGRNTPAAEVDSRANDALSTTSTDRRISAAFISSGDDAWKRVMVSLGEGIGTLLHIVTKLDRLNNDLAASISTAFRATASTSRSRPDFGTFPAALAAFALVLNALAPKSTV
jgi:hypothetical protein